MTKRALFGALIAVACVALFSLPTVVAAPVTPKALRVALSNPPGPLDPATARTPEEFAPAAVAYEQLVSPAGGPELAKSWTNSGLDWTFQLADGHYFASGRKVNAAAVKFSLDRVLAIGRGNAGDLIDRIARVRLAGPMAVTITVKRPTPRLPKMLADRSASIIDPQVAARAKGGDNGAGWLASRTAGSGPYTLRPTRGGGVVVFDRNPYWRLKPGYFDRIVFRVVSDPIIRALAISRGVTDVAVQMPSQSVKRLSQDHSIKIVSIAVPAYQNLAFNLERGVLRNVTLRRAIGAAIDAPAIVRDIRGGRASVFHGPLADGMPGFDPALYPVRFDPARAALLARAAKIKKGTRLTMIYPGVSAETDTVAQYIQAVVAPLGIQLRLERLSIPAYVDRMDRGNYDMVLMGFVATNDDATATLNYWFDPEKFGTDNPARYRNTEVAKLIRAAADEGDVAKRAELHRRIAFMVNRDLPYIYLQQTQITNAVRREITGYRIDPLRPIEIDPLEIGRSL